MINTSSFLQTVQTDAFLVSNFYNILYATGFETLSPSEREAYVLITKEKIYVITDSRYERGEVNEEIAFSFTKEGKTVTDVLTELCKQHSVTALGYEADNLTWNEVQRLQKIGPKLTPLSRAFSSLRSMKRAEEIFAIKQACHIGDLVLKDVTPYLHPGQTEKEIAWLMERSIREGYGAEVAFDPIVAVDEHSAIPHYNTKKGSGVIREDSLLLLDFGVKKHNYCSDITRMVAIGEVPAEIISTYTFLLSAQKKTIENLQSNENLKDADLFCRNELKTHNIPNYMHSTGHGIGLEVHEFPRVSGLSEDNKKSGQVFTIEPGVYYPGKWGMRIEDTVAILDQGEIEVLTRFPKELILL
jgi:Xaa-Pro aminopeptidase